MGVDRSTASMPCIHHWAQDASQMDLWPLLGRPKRVQKLSHTVDASDIRQTHHLRLVVEIPLFTGCYHHPRWFSRRISEASTVGSMGRLYIHLHEWLTFEVN